MVDCLGLSRPVLAVAVTAAGVQDRDATVPALARLREQYFSIRLVRADRHLCRETGPTRRSSRRPSGTIQHRIPRMPRSRWRGR
ncbi:hypothetical protein [Streptomyces sp. R35]|uniref:Uncharacterized protein n=1 Tax=Streptomyces sp. R35 TaxID=3238630 RepID=A0AB39SPF5_9ACTN